MSEREFQPWPKIARLNREIVVTEKIDGTNAAIVVTEDGDIYAQSRKRLITPEDDNFGFAKWVDDRKDELVDLLGPGRHFGEWWGSGIQRGYGLERGEKRFSLFNTKRWASPDWHMRSTPAPIEGLFAVPVLYQGPFSHRRINEALDLLESEGSMASPGFLDAEGVVVFHTAANQMFKVTIKDDEVPKALAAKGVA